MDLRSSCMLVSLNISTWSGQRVDRKITSEVHAQHGVAGGAGRYTKNLLAPSAFKGIRDTVSAARAAHYRRTLPWSDEGHRILTTLGFLDYQADMARHAEAMREAVGRFIFHYETNKNVAKRDLNGLYNEADYPNEAELRLMFSLRTNILPIPSGLDFRVDLSEAHVTALREQTEARMQEETASAIKHVWKRIADTVGHMADRLEKYKVTGELIENPFRDTLVENVRELAEILPSLNLTHDPELARVSDEITKSLTKTDADTLRQSEAARATVASRAKEIADLAAVLA